MAKAKDISELKDSALVHVKTVFKGRIKKLFIQDLEKGEKASDLVRQMANVFYEQKENRAKHGY